MVGEKSRGMTDCDDANDFYSVTSVIAHVIDRQQRLVRNGPPCDFLCPDKWAILSAVQHAAEESGLLYIRTYIHTYKSRNLVGAIPELRRQGLLSAEFR